MSKEVKKETYAMRYRVDEWNKPIEEAKMLEQGKGFKIYDSPWGYTDNLFIISMIEGGTWMLMDTRAENPLYPTREQLIEVRDFLNHYIEHHT